MTIIEKVISEWFKKKEKKLSINQNFIKSNIIDSFDLMELITFCEKYYDIRFFFNLCPFRHRISIVI